MSCKKEYCLCFSRCNLELKEVLCVQKSFFFALVVLNRAYLLNIKAQVHSVLLSPTALVDFVPAVHIIHFSVSANHFYWVSPCGRASLERVIEAAGRAHKETIVVSNWL